jgi:hypothetical protein
MNEPTRVLIYDHLVGSGTSFYFSPAQLTRFANKSISPADAMASSLQAIERVVVPNVPNLSPYASGLGDTRYNLLMSLSDLEIEKGIVTHMLDNPAEFLTAAAAANMALSPEEVKKVALHELTRTEDLPPDVSSLKEKQAAGYLRVMYRVADYQLSLRKLNRRLTIQAHGLRYIAPGFPCFVFGTHKSYWGRVVNFGIEANPDGAEMSSVELDYTREIPSKRIDFTSVKQSVDLIGAPDDLLKKTSEDRGFIQPPPHFPREMMFSGTLDAIYAELFGSPAFYAPGGTQKVSTISEDLGDQLFEQQDMLEAVTKVFPIFDAADTTIPRGESASEWERRSSGVATQKTDLSESPYDWEMRNYHRRPQAMRLSEYADVNELVVHTETSEAGFKFFRLSPAADGAGVQGIPYYVAPPFDDSGLSLIVDENARVGAGGSDAFIRELRSDVLKVPAEERQPLTTTERQDQWLRYARRHHGPRAFYGQ